MDLVLNKLKIGIVLNGEYVLSYLKTNPDIHMCYYEANCSEIPVNGIGGSIIRFEICNNFYIVFAITIYKDLYVNTYNTMNWSEWKKIG